MDPSQGKQGREPLSPEQHLHESTLKRCRYLTLEQQLDPYDVYHAMLMVVHELFHDLYSDKVRIAIREVEDGSEDGDPEFPPTDQSPPQG